MSDFVKSILDGNKASAFALALMVVDAHLSHVLRTGDEKQSRIAKQYVDCSEARMAHNALLLMAENEEIPLLFENLVFGIEEGAVKPLVALSALRQRMREELGIGGQMHYRASTLWVGGGPAMLEQVCEGLEARG